MEQFIKPFNILVDIGGMYETPWNESLHTIHINPVELPTIMHFRCILRDMFGFESLIILKLGEAVLHDLDSIDVINPAYHNSKISIFIDNGSQPRSPLQTMLEDIIITSVNGQKMSKTIAKRFFSKNPFSIDSQSHKTIPQDFRQENKEQSIQSESDNSIRKKITDTPEITAQDEISLNEKRKHFRFIEPEYYNTSEGRTSEHAKKKLCSSLGAFVNYLRERNDDQPLEENCNNESENNSQIQKRKRVRRHRKKGLNNSDSSFGFSTLFKEDTETYVNGTIKALETNKSDVTEKMDVCNTSLQRSVLYKNSHINFDI